MTHSCAQTGTDTEDVADSVPASVVLARILRSMLPSDAELHQDRKLWQELWVRSQRDTAARHLAVDLYDQLHAWVGGAVERASAPGSSPTATSRPSPPRYWPCTTVSASA